MNKVFEIENNSEDDYLNTYGDVDDIFELNEECFASGVESDNKNENISGLQ